MYCLLKDGADCQGMPSLSQYLCTTRYQICLVVSLLATNTKSLLVYECHVLFNILDSFGKLSHVMSGEQVFRYLATVPEELRRHEPIYPPHNRTRRRRKRIHGTRAGTHVAIAKKKARARRKAFRVTAAWIGDMDLIYQPRWIRPVCLADLQPDQLFYPCWRGVRR